MNPNLTSATYVKQIQDKKIFVGPYTVLAYAIRNSSSPPKFLKENLVTIPVVFYTKKDFPLLRVFNEKIEQMRAAGLVTYWHQKSLNLHLEKEAQESPKQLNIQQLSGCFEVLCIGYLISISVFILEHVTGMVKRFLTKK